MGAGEETEADAEEVASPPISYWAIGSPTCTTSSSETSHSTSTPSSGAGTSLSTLSVAISTTAWSASTFAPASTRNLIIVASATLSPILGRRISMIAM